MGESMSSQQLVSPMRCLVRFEHIQQHASVDIDWKEFHARTKVLSQFFRLGTRQKKKKIKGISLKRQYSKRESCIFLEGSLTCRFCESWTECTLKDFHFLNTYS